MLGFVIPAVAPTEGHTRLLVIVAGAVVLWVAGTVDDRRLVRPWIRVGLEVAVAAVLWAVGGLGIRRARRTA